jgi:hypothetical protein
MLLDLIGVGHFLGGTDLSRLLCTTQIHSFIGSSSTSCGEFYEKSGSFFAIQGFVYGKEEIAGTFAFVHGRWTVSL